MGAVQGALLAWALVSTASAAPHACPEGQRAVLAPSGEFDAEQAKGCQG
jgi:hypothetical protein